MLSIAKHRQYLFENTCRSFCHSEELQATKNLQFPCTRTQLQTLRCAQGDSEGLKACPEPCEGMTRREGFFRSLLSPAPATPNGGATVDLGQQLR